MRTVFAVTAAITLLVGCASTETVRESRGEGTKKIYSVSYETVYPAVLRAAKSEKLDIVSTDREAGRVDLSHGVTLWSWGERISIFLTKVSAQKAEVEIVSKPVLAPLNFPPDWQNRLLKAIDRELKLGS